MKFIRRRALPLERTIIITTTITTTFRVDKTADRAILFPPFREPMHLRVLAKPTA
jgi:hypothetical protein